MVGIIVDGEGDYASLKKRFNRGFKVLKTDGPRGHTARVTDIAVRSRKQILILAAFRCERVIVVLDFEARPVSYGDFVREVAARFGELRMPIPVAVAVPNRMIENWYLADIEFLSTQKAFLREGAHQKAYEGRDGKEILKRLMKRGVTYSETQHGPELFEILRFDVARHNSPSFDVFLRAVGRLE